MLKRRLILCLLMDNEGVFHNSRNFGLQRVGELDWILQYLDFESIDELVVLNVDRGDKDLRSFATHVARLGRFCFVPIAAGGGVRSLGDCDRLLASGADKIVINSALHEVPGFLSSAAAEFGRQCMVASIDYRRAGGDGTRVLAGNGTLDTGRDAIGCAQWVEREGAGEIFLTSIDHDGTGMGYDLGVISAVTRSVRIPVIASGGVGDFQHLVEGIRRGGASAVSAANIFHFIGSSLTKAKSYVRGQGLDFPVWNFM